MNKKINLYDTWLVNRTIAHRGLHDERLPENSLGAFRAAVEKGYAIETDLQLTADGVIVVFHDEKMKRMTGRELVINDCMYDEIKDIPLIGGENEYIPTLEQLLETVDGKVPLLIEIKTHENIGSLEAPLTERLRRYNGEFAVQSFNPFIVKWFRKNAPEFVRGQLAAFFDVKGLAAAARIAQLYAERNMRSSVYILRHQRDKKKKAASYKEEDACIDVDCEDARKA